MSRAFSRVLPGVRSGEAVTKVHTVAIAVVEFDSLEPTMDVVALCTDFAVE